MKILQSTQGFIFFPYPCLGFRNIVKYALPTFTTVIGTPRFLAASTVPCPALHEQKKPEKFKASTSIPWLRISFVASILSNPPENITKAFTLAILSAAASGFSVVIVGKNSKKTNPFNVSLLISSVGLAILWPLAFLLTDLTKVNPIG